MAAAERDESAAAEPGARAQSKDRFSVTPEVHRLLALWKGNVAAIQRDLTPGERAGLAGGERAARKHDVFLARPRGWRNQAWETDHVQAPVLVEVDGKPRRPWTSVAGVGAVCPVLRGPAC